MYAFIFLVLFVVFFFLNHPGSSKITHLLAVSPTSLSSQIKNVHDYTNR